MSSKYLAPTGNKPSRVSTVLTQVQLAECQADLSMALAPEASAEVVSFEYQRY